MNTTEKRGHQSQIRKRVVQNKVMFVELCLSPMPISGSKSPTGDVLIGASYITARQGREAIHQMVGYRHLFQIVGCNLLENTSYV